MRLSAFLRFNTKVLEPFIKKLRSEAPTYIAPGREVIHKKFTDLNNWYTKLIGLDEVRMYQDRVVNLQERLLSTQEQRRDVGRNLAEIRYKSNQLQEELHKIKRQENLERFLNLMKEETELLRLEHEVASKFQEYDQTERELFTAFTNAIRDSHEKQRAQLEYTKYFGIILSIVGSFLTFCYSTLRKDDLKRYIGESLAKQNATNSSSSLVNDSTSSSSSVDDGDEEPESVAEVIRNETQKLGEILDSRLNQTRMEMYLYEQQQRVRQDVMIFAFAVTVGILFTCRLIF